jgi:hypothetical protein
MLNARVRWAKGLPVGRGRSSSLRRRGAPSRRMAESLRVASILRDAMLRMAPQDEVGAGFTARNLPDGQITSPSADRMSSPSSKNIPIFRNRKSVYTHRHPALTRGALRGRHGRWVRDAVDADSAFDEWRESGRRSRVVLTPRRWRQVLEKQASQG